MKDVVGLGIVPGIPGDVSRCRIPLEPCHVDVRGGADHVGVLVASDLAAVHANPGRQIIVGR